MTYDEMMNNLEDRATEKASVFRHVLSLILENDPTALSAAIFYIDEYASIDQRLAMALDLARRMKDEDAAELMSHVLDAKPNSPSAPHSAPFNVKAYGKAVGEHKRAMVKLGREMARETALGLRKPEDALDVMTEFNIEASVASGQFERPSQPGKVQVSKFRRYFEAGAKFGDDAVDLIDRASDVYINSINRNSKYRGMDIESGEYNSIVRVLRRALEWGRCPTNTEIFQIMIGEI